MKIRTMVVLCIGLMGCATHAMSADSAKNVVLCIGDGMGVQEVLAAHDYHGGNLSFEALTNRALVTTLSTGANITDSAAAATAMATGKKVANHVVSVAVPGDGEEMTTLLEYFKARGKRTGLVTTSYMTDATPAGFGAHALDRANTSEIATDYLAQTRPFVLFGGGGNGMSYSAAIAASYVVVTNAVGLASINSGTTNPVSGQFGVGWMPYERNGMGSLPHLSNMTDAALKIMTNAPDGFFLMVEGGLIDMAGHANNITNSIWETLEFANSTRVVLDWAQGRTDTVVIVLADHETGGLRVLQDNGVSNYPSVTWTGFDHTASNVPVYFTGKTPLPPVIDNTDLFELITGVTPQAARATNMVVADSSATANWSAAYGKAYRVDYSPNLSAPVPGWTSLTTITATANRVSFTDAGITDVTSRFYRCTWIR